MKLASCGGVELRCSIPVLLIIPAAVALGRTDTLLIFFISLLAHELSHALMARRLGHAVYALEIQPFGFIARLSDVPASPSETAAISAAGPLVSLLLALSSAGLLLFCTQSASFSPFLSELFSLRENALSEFSSFNLTLGAVNLLPVLPLDGGRLALALAESRRTGRGRSHTAALLSMFGVFAGAFIAAAGVYLIFTGGFSAQTVSLAVTGAFIALSALVERKNSGERAARSRLVMPSRLSRGACVRVVPVAMSAGCTVRDALRAVSGSGYGVILVVDEAMTAIGTLDEGRLLSAALSHKAGATLLSLLPHGERYIE